MGAPDRADGLPSNLHAAREVLASVREALSGPDPSVAGVLYAVQAALGAEELFLLCSRGDVCGAGVEVTAFPVRKEMWTLQGFELRANHLILPAAFRYVHHRFQAG